MVAELESITRNNTLELVDRPTGVDPIRLKWIYKIKRKVDGMVNKYKVRLVAKGYVQRKEIDFDKVFPLVARLETKRLLISLATVNGWKIHHLNVNTAYLNGDRKELVYVTQSEGFEKKKREECVTESFVH